MSSWSVWARSRLVGAGGVGAGTLGDGGPVGIPRRSRIHPPGTVCPVETPPLLSPRLDVAVVCPTSAVGGAERWLLRLLDATDRLDVRAVVMGDEGPLHREWRRRGVPVVTVPTGRGTAAVVRAARSLRRVLSDLDADVVLANGVRAAVAAAPSALLDGRALVWAKHDHAVDGPTTRLLARACTEIVAPSTTVGRAGTGREPAVVAPPLSAGTPLHRGAARAELARLASAHGRPIPRDALLAVAVGSLIPLKGLSDGVDAVAATTGWHLAVIGEDHPDAPGLGASLGARADEAGAGGRVHVLGAVPEAARLMAGADALLQLTRPAGPGPGREGYGMAVLEAAAGGTAVVCTPCPAADALLEAGASTGVTQVPPGDVGAVARALDALAPARPLVEGEGEGEAAGRGDGPARAAGDAARGAASHHPSAAVLADTLASALAVAAGRAGAGVPVRGAPAVSVVAPLFTEGPHVGALVRSVAAHLRPGDELLAVDDASPDDTAEQVLAAAAATSADVALVRRTSNGGVGAARNSGVERARHELVVFADAGTHPAPGWLDAMRAAGAATPAPGLLTGRYAISRRGPWEAAVAAACYPDPRPRRSAGPWRRAWHAVFGLRVAADSPAGRSLAITRTAWTRIGGFDDRRRAAEDVDAAHAVRGAGLGCVLVSDASVTWDQAPTWRGTAAMYRHYGRGDAQAHHGRAVARDVVRAAAYLVGPALALLPGPAAGLRRVLVGCGAAAYVSVPVARSLEDAPRGGAALRTAALVPCAMAVKDLAKAAGALEVLVRRVLDRDGT